MLGWLLLYNKVNHLICLVFPGGSMVKNPPAIAGDTDSIPNLGLSPGEGNGNPLQYSCLENPMHRGAWQATVHGFARVRHDLATKRPPCTQQQRHSTAKNKEINKNRGIKKFFNLKDAMEAQAPTTPLSYMTLCTLPCVC